MASTISNSNYYSVSASSNNGVAGLVSGMDTDSMVKQMLSGTQSKIDAKKQEKQQYEWRQEQYQEVITSINSFSGKYFDTSYDSKLATNLSSASLFNSMVSTITSGSSVKLVSTGTGAATGTTTIRVDALASAAKLQSAQKLSGSQTITGTGIDADTIKSRLSSGGEFTFDLTLDGVKKTITLTKSDFETNGEFDESLVTSANIASALGTKTEKAFGDYIKYTANGDEISFAMNIKSGEAPAPGETDNRPLENGHELVITGSDANYLGIKPGASTLVTGTTKLGSLANVSGDVFKFSINGTDFEFDSNTTVSKMMNTINSSSAGVRMTYSSMTDSFAIEQTSTGKGYGIDLAQESGNLMSVIFGAEVIAAGESTLSTALNTSGVNGHALAEGYETTEATMKMTVNGTEYTFSLPEEEGTTYDAATVESRLNTWLSDTFGETNGTANISYSDGKLSTALGYNVSFASTTVDTDDPALAAEAGKTDLAIAFGFSTKAAGASNAITADTTAGEIAGLTGYANPDTKLSELTEINFDGHVISASFADGRLSLTTAGEYDFRGTGLESLFGARVEIGDGEALTESDEYEAAFSAGTDAKVAINGVETTRASNTFSFDGLTVTATAVSAEETVIGTARDTEKIIETIKSFVNDYNTLIEDLYGRVTQDADYRNYKPLTTEQEDEMTDKQIELWEEKAQKGLLRGDTDINTLIDSMRSAVYTSAGDSGLALFSIGIESESWNGAGKLTIDEDMLRTAVESDPEGVSTLFTDKTSGVATVLSKACDTAAKISLAGTGTLVAKAGAKDWTANAKNNDIYFELQRIDDRLDYLNDLYQTQKTRYWNQFSSMETIMQSYNSQSAMLTNMFS